MSIHRNSLFFKFLIWRIKHINDKNFMLIISIFVGVFSGLAVVALKSIVYYIRSFLTYGFDIDRQHYLYAVYPMIGLLLTSAYIIYLNKNKIGAGISNILYTISRKSSIMEPDKMYSHLISSSLTVGFGGSVGLEAPIVTTGSAIASNIGRLMHMDYKKRTLLIGCGAASATAAIFNAPITGVLFALEVLLLDLSIPSFIPILLASVTSTIVAKLLMGHSVLFNINVNDPFILKQLPLYILLGVIAGFLSVYFGRGVNWAEEKLLKYKTRLKKGVIGGSILGLMIFIFPPLYGEGYEILEALLSGRSEEILYNSMFYGLIDNSYAIIIFVTLIILFKTFATGVTMGAGGNGGVFAPSLFTGALVGFLFSKSINMFHTGLELSESNFALVGMAGLMSGVLHAPLTSMFLIAEITGGYELILPLMLVSTISYATTVYFEPYSIFAKRLARKGDLIDHDKDKEVLTILKLQRVIEKDFVEIHPEKTLGDLVEAVSQSRRNIYPIVDENRILCGIILLDDIRDIMFKPDKYHISVSELMHMPPGYVFTTDTMDAVMEKFQMSGAWNLPVMDEDQYIGFVSKSKIFSVYRRLLIHHSRK